VQVYRSKSAAQQLANEFLKPFNDGTFSPDNAMGLDQFIENLYLPEINPKGKRGKRAVHVIARLKVLLESYLERISPKNYVFQTLKGGPESGIVWHGWHACRRGLATNLHELGVPDIVIQAILRHREVSVTRNAYIKRSEVDKPSRDAMTALEQLVCNQSATLPVETPASVVVQ
jgi:integrase